MDTPIPLSVVILTRNEAGRIRDCIQSVRWADEVLVIDDESTDDTVQIAESLGGRVLRRKMDIEGRHRNWAHAQAKHEWILSLDADERVTPALAEEIRALVENGAAHPLYAIPRRNYIGTRWIRYGGWYPSAQLKLFQKSVFRWEETTVHPRAIGSGSCGQTRYDLLHFSYRDEQDFLQKVDRQTTLEAEKWVAEGRGVSLAKALWRTCDRFVRTYVGKQGFREGRLGWFIARMAARYQWHSYVKYKRLWRQRDASRVTASYGDPMNARKT
ncbi:MAG: glycosyltransferase family 2 protein [Candidatus Omnitrophica bacterium]|nr:glycosyltransferase family 2 protein [Candidatus Omnitrophota bacterium]